MTMDFQTSFPNKEGIWKHHILHTWFVPVHFMLAYHFTVLKCVVPIFSLGKLKAEALR